MKVFLLAAAAAFSCLAAGAMAQGTLGDRLRQQQPSAFAPVTVQVACGRLDKSNCGQVIPRLLEHLGPNTILRPVESEGSIESTTGVCEGVVEAAIAQRDSVNQRVRRDCVGKVDLVGRPLYPYYGYLVVAASNRADSIEDLVRNVGQGQTVRIAAGSETSGGQTTMQAMLDANPAWKRAVTVSNYSQDTALQRITSGSIDAFFVMDSPHSELLENIRSSVDAREKRVFKFLDVRPGSGFYGLKDWRNQFLYQEVVLEGGIFSSTKTVSTDAVLIMGNAFRENRQNGGTRAAEALGNAVERAVPGILADTRAPRDWTPATARTR